MGPGQRGVKRKPCNEPIHGKDEARSPAWAGWVSEGGGKSGEGEVDGTLRAGGFMHPRMIFAQCLQYARATNGVQHGIARRSRPVFNAPAPPPFPNPRPVLPCSCAMKPPTRY